ncbi:lysophosphatidyl acyltransferase 5 [Actinidia rufa]|uniref:Lysophosphatidyl acyltransferase 5 n=1 Tax=Actinidia rufa TaxID=165716 RepID=A0A7J0EU84_9ERIC|nr:lysophosphatidyl acyltransferase 5 [Actinidia rufa]
MEADSRYQMEGHDRPRNRALTPLRNIHYSRKITSFFFGAWLALWPFLFEKINKTKVVFSGNRVPARERIVLIANQKTEVDWMYLWDLALLERRWEVDGLMMHRMLSTFKDPQVPLWLVVFPEGTDFT